MNRFLPFLALIALAGCSDGDSSPRAAGNVASDFKVETLSIPSATASLHTKRGKVVILDFWATWCGPCRQISPVIESIYKQHKAEGLEAMAITTEAREIVALVEKQRPHEMPVYLDADLKATKAYAATALPTIVVIGRDGRIVYQTQGITEHSPDEINAAVVEALKAS